MTRTTRAAARLDLGPGVTEDDHTRWIGQSGWTTRFWVSSALTCSRANAPDTETTLPLEDAMHCAGRIPGLSSLALAVSLLWGCADPSPVTSPSDDRGAEPDLVDQGQDVTDEEEDAAVTDIVEDSAAADIVDTQTDPDLTETEETLEDVPGWLQFGDECEWAGDCESGYCVSSGTEGGSVCSTACTRACPPGFECWLMVDERGDSEQVCQAADTLLCSPCETDWECGGGPGLCEPVGDEMLCVLGCGPGSTCPFGFTCEIVSRPQRDAVSVCQPDGDACPECIGVDLDTDVDNCGACGHECEADDAVVACVDGTCVIDACFEGFDDCDEEFDTGCETDLLSPDGCGSCAELEGTPGSRCGVCDSGVWVCEGTDQVRCPGDRGAEALNVCGGCNTLPFEEDAPCGTCDSGEWSCRDSETLECDGDRGDEALNTCGGCTAMDYEEGAACGTCGTDGQWQCEGLEVLACDDPTPGNACSGCAELAGSPGTPCGTCGSGLWSCDVGGEFVECEGDRGPAVLNACGGCDGLPVAWRSPCGTCDTGQWECATENTLECVGDLGDGGRNACGGCGALDHERDAPCGDCGDDGRYVCDGFDALLCEDPTPANACGGCSTLVTPPGSVCGRCGLDRTVCAGDGESTACITETTNACGGCDEISIEPEDLGQPCGTCLSGRWDCAGENEELCRADLGDAALNGCRGCASLANPPGTPCGPCLLDSYTCDGTDATTCSGATECPAITCRLGGTLSTRTIRFSDSPCIVESDATLPSDATLTVEPGVVFKFMVTRTTNEQDRDLFVEGNLVARGTAERPIIFTSYYDDAWAGDSNGDGSATAPAPGDWGAVQFSDAWEGELSHVHVLYGGGNDYPYDYRENNSGTAALTVDSAAPPILDTVLVSSSQSRGALLNVTGGFDWSVADSTFSHNGGTGLEITGDRAPITLEGIRAELNQADGVRIAIAGDLTMSAFAVSSNSSDGVLIDTTGTLDLRDSVISNHPGNTNLVVSAASESSRVRDNTITANNTRQPDSLETVASAVPDVIDELVDYNTLSATDRGLVVRGGTLHKAVTWAEPGYEYVLSGTVTIAPSASLAIEPGNVFKFEPTRERNINDVSFVNLGQLDIDGTSDDPVVFTSLYDDTYGGDTNGDGVSSDGAAGDWGRLFYDTSGVGSVSWVEFYYGGGNDYPYDYKENNPGTAAIEVASTTPPSMSQVTVHWSQTTGALFTVASGVDWALADFDARNNGRRGVDITGGAGHLAAERLIAVANGTDGIVAQTAGPLTVTGASSHFNGATGITASTPSVLTLTDSQIADHGASTGLVVLSAHHSSQIRGNTIARAGVVASVVPDVVDELVDHNTVTETERGLYVRAGSVNHVAGWDDYGIEYVLDGSVTVSATGDLTLAPGVVLKVVPNRTENGSDRQLAVRGQLTAVGTEGSPIVFTSAFDDTRGGDTNGDAAATGPEPGDWMGLLFDGGGGGELSRVEVHYAGGGDYPYDYRENNPGAAAFHVDNPAPPSVDHLTVTFSQSRGGLFNVTGGDAWSLDDSSFLSNGGRGLEVTGEAAQAMLTQIVASGNGAEGLSAATSGPLTLEAVTAASNGTDGIALQTTNAISMSNCQMTGNPGTALVVSGAAGSSTFRDNTLSGSHLVAQLVPNVVADVVDNNTLSNTERGLHVYGGTLGQTSRWNNSGFAYVLDGSLVVPSGNTLTLAAGTVMKFDVTRSQNRHDYAIDVAGGLVATGESDQPITLTSLYDDTVGGDTNGDGASTSPAGGDWNRVHVQAGGSATLSWVAMSYGGGNDYPYDYRENNPGDAILRLDGTATVADLNVGHSGTDGIRIGAGSGTLDRVHTHDNQGYGVNLEASALCDTWSRSDLTYAGNVSGDLNGCP